MKKLSPYVQFRKEFKCGICNMWSAYFRGTNNRVCRESGAQVQSYTKLSNLRFDLLNNPMERGVVIE